VFSACRRTLGSMTWGRVLAAMENDKGLEDFPDRLETLCGTVDLPGYIADLARLEWMLYQTDRLSPGLDRLIQTTTVNPTLKILPLRWKQLAVLIRTSAEEAVPFLEPNHVMAWKHPRTHDLQYREAEAIDLLALKLIVEQIDPKTAATQGHATPGDLQDAIDQAVAQGILLSPGSRIRRTPGKRVKLPPHVEPFLSSDVFTLQWHITQACDLQCKHCYDRSDRTPLPLERAESILEDFYDFCRRMHVRGQVTFTGGNPMLYPHIESVYRTASTFGFGIAVLGNPGHGDRLRRLMQIAKPLYFQISLEGLADHNDFIRGKGHFNRSLKFLKELKELGIFSMVMLTLTRDNLDQVLPLAECLRERVDAFNFNRLSTVGEGAGLLMPEKQAFASFLKQYATAAESNPIMGFKDNLFNILRHENGDSLFGGCTGHGCGAAFNFVALLPDGEVHACRKFPSPIGNMLDTGLFDIYHGRQAKRYRSGSSACRDCRLNMVCRGCLAITHSTGWDVFSDKDPYCFASPRISGGQTGNRHNGGAEKTE
jgi:selenobiotic family peptide radical SAM maturase